MTPDEFRSIALAFPETSEGSHMGHADFRVAGRIFATLGYPDDRYAVTLLTPQDQEFLVRDYPKAFAAVPGGWGASGSTRVILSRAGKRAVALALEAAWRNRAPKKTVRARDEQRAQRG